MKPATALLLTLAAFATTAAPGHAADTPAPPKAAPPPPLAGAWRLVETRQRLTDGSTRPDPDLGAHPGGYMIYDPSGRMCTMFSDTDRPGWASPKPTDAELRAAYDHTVIYCARYEVDSGRGVITFHLDLGLNPGPGATRERRFTLTGDTLTLYPAPLPAGVTDWSVRLQRVLPGRRSRAPRNATQLEILCVWRTFPP